MIAMPTRCAYRSANSSHQRGIALLIVLWMSVLLTVVAGSFAYLSQVESLLARRATDRVQALEAASAGLQMAIYQLKHSDLGKRPWADGRPYQLSFNGADLVLSIQDEKGKISINRASDDLLSRLLQSAGLEVDAALEMTDGILDFIDGDDLVRLNGAEIQEYRAAGLPYGPKNESLVVLEELLQVYGMSYEIYQKVAPALSVYSSSAEPDWNLAPSEVLNTLDEANPQIVSSLIQERFDQFSLQSTLSAWPSGRQFILARGSGPIYTVDIEVTLPNESRTQLSVIINTSQRNDLIPFKLLHWHEM